MPPIQEGKTAPAFHLADQHGDKHRLRDFHGKPLVIFFYPKDLTSGCTLEVNEFQALLPQFKRAGVAVASISILGVKSKCKFADKEGLSFPLLADDRTNDDGKPDPEIARKYGVWVEKSMYGRKYMGIERTTFLVDANSNIAKRWDKVKVPGHAQEVLDAAKALAKK